MTHVVLTRNYQGQVDLLVGGAPCQAFSMVGRRLGFEDARGTLFYEFARVIKEAEPKVFVFENVIRINQPRQGQNMAGYVLNLQRVRL